MRFRKGGKLTVIKTGIATVILCLILVLTGGFGVKDASAQESVWVKVGNIPDNWYKSVEEPLGSYEGEFGDVEDDKDTAALMNIWSTSDVAQADEVYQEWDKEKAAKEKETELE